MCMGIASGYYPPETKETYICNRKKCENCHPECERTTDKRYAVNEKRSKNE